MRALDQLAELRGRIDSLSAELSAVKKQADRIEELVVGSSTTTKLAPTEDPSVSVPPVVLAADAPVAPSLPVAVAEPPALPPPLPTMRTDVGTVSEETPPAESERWDKIRAALERLQLWPPSDETDAEVRLGAWWATRIGLLCAVIGAVFFGVYVSQYTPAWVKLAELVGATIAAGGLGLWLERRVPRFGAALVGGALALGYFAAYGAYALPALKVIDSAVAGAAVQVAAAAIVFASAWRRSSPAEAVLAVALGLVAAAFSVTHGLPNWALLVGFGLSAAAVAMRWRFEWDAPSVVALPGAYALLAWTGWSVWSPALGPMVAWIWTAAFAVLFGVRDWASLGADGERRLGAAVRTFVGANATLALAVGAGLSWWLGREVMEVFYFGAGGAMTLAALALRRRVAEEPLVAVWLAKATALVGLGLISIGDARTRWIVLLVQAATMLVTAQRLRERSLWWLSAVVAVVAAGFFGLFAETASLPLARGLGLAAVAFVIGWIVWAAWAERTGPEGELAVAVRMLASVIIGVLIAGLAWIGREEVWTPPLAFVVVALSWVVAVRIRVNAPAIGAVLGAVVLALAVFFALYRPETYAWSAAAWMAATMLGLLLGFAAAVERERPQDAIVAGGLLVVFTAVLVMSPAWSSTGWAPALASAVGMLVGLGAWRRRSTVWTIAAAGLLWSAEAALLSGGSIRGLALWANVGPILALAGAGAWAAVRARAHVPERSWPLVAWAIVGPAVLVLSVALAWEFALVGTVIGAGVLAWSLVALAERAEVLPLRAAALVPLLMVLTESLQFHDTGALGWAAVIAVWLPAVWMRLRERAGIAPAGVFVRGAMLALGTWVLICAASTMTRDSHIAALTLVAAGAVMLGLARWPGVAGALASATMLMLVWALTTLIGGQGSGALAVGWLGAPLWLAVPVVARRLLHDPMPRWRRWAVSVHGLVVLGVLVAVSLRAGPAFEDYATVGWGLAAVAVFVAGLVGRERVYRLLGLAGVALAVARVFLVDLDSTVTRIGAFIGLGLLLLWVGFSYHRFRRWIIEEPAEAGPTGKG